MRKRKATLKDDYNLEPCQMCGNKVPYGPHRYDLKKVGICGHALFICPNCRNSGSEEHGFAPHQFKTIENVFAKNGWPAPVPNAQGEIHLEPI